MTIIFWNEYYCFHIEQYYIISFESIMCLKFLRSMWHDQMLYIKQCDLKSLLAKNISYSEVNNLAWYSVLYTFILVGNINLFVYFLLVCSFGLCALGLVKLLLLTSTLNKTLVVYSQYDFGTKHYLFLTFSRSHASDKNLPFEKRNQLHVFYVINHKSIWASR